MEGFGRQVAVEWGEQRGQRVHALFHLSLLGTHRQTELAHGLGARIFAAVVVHGPRASEAEGGAASLRIQTYAKYQIVLVSN